MSGLKTSCDFCGDPIRPSDFDKGVALVLLKKTYCSRCLSQAVQRKKARVPPGGGPVASPGPATPQEPFPPTPARTSVPPVSRDHSCGIFASDEERRTQASRFVCDGLRNGEKVIYALHAPTPEKILGDFRKGGLPAEPYLRKGQLEILPSPRLYLVEGILDPMVTAARIEQAMDRALAGGFPGFRLAGELTGVLEHLKDIRPIAEYEMNLNSALARSRCSAMCLYPVSDLVRTRLPEVVTAHAVLYGGNHLKVNVAHSSGAPVEAPYPVK